MFPPRGETSLNGLYEYIRPKSIWFSDPSVIHRVWFLLSRRELGMVFEEATFTSVSLRPSTKVLHDAFNKGLNYITNCKAALK